MNDTIINVYKDAFTDTHVEYKNASGCTFAEVFADKDLSSALIMVNGHKVNADYRIKTGDIATIRFYPEGGLTTAAIVSIVGWSVLGATVVSGVIAWNVSPKFRSWVKGLFIDNDSSEREKKETINISGVSNSSGKDKPVPIILGKHLLTPNYWGQFYTELDPNTPKGKKRISHVLYNLGYNDLEVSDIKLKYTALASNKENKSTGDIVIDSTAFNSVKDSIKVELQTSNEVSVYPQRVIQQDFGTEIQKIQNKEPVPIQIVTATNPMKIEVEIGFNGLYQTDNEGNRKNEEVALRVEYRDGGDNGFHVEEDSSAFGTLTTNYINSSFENEESDVEPVILELVKSEYSDYDYYKKKGSDYIPFYGEISASKTLYYDFSVFYPYVEYYSKKKKHFGIEYNPIKKAKYIIKVYRKIVTTESWKQITISGDGVTFDSSKNAYVIKQNDINEMRFVASKTFSFSDVSYMINKTSENFMQLRITRITDNSTDTKHCDKAYLTSVRTYSFDTDKSKTANELVTQTPIIEEVRNLTTRCGFKIEATEALKDQIEAFNCIVKSKAPYWISATYNESGEVTEEGHWAVDDEGNLLTRAENNPAALTLLVMRHPTLKENKIPLEKINLDKLGELYEFCESAGYTCNMVVSSQLKLGDLIYKILACGHAFPVLDNNQYSFIIDHKQDYPVMIVNNRNILSHGLKNSKDFNELPDRLRVHYVDEDLNYQNNTIDVWVDDSKASNPPTNPKTEDVTLEGVTKNTEAYRRGKYELAKRIARPETWVRCMSVDGALIGVGDKFEIQDDTLLVGIGDGACISSFVKDSNNNILGFKTDAAIYLEPDSQLEEGDSYAVKIVHTDGINDPEIKTFKLTNSVAGKITEWTFEESISPDDDFIPSVGDACAFGVFGKVTQSALCLSKKGNDDGTYEITAVPYDEDVYLYDTEDSSKWTLPTFKSNITRPVSGGEIKFIPKDTVTREEVEESISQIETETTTIRYLKLSSLTTKINSSGAYDSVTVYAMTKTGEKDEEYFTGYFEVTGGTLWAESGESVNVTPTSDKCVVSLKASASGEVIDRATIVSLSDGTSPYILSITGKNVIKNNSGTVTLTPQLMKGEVKILTVPQNHTLNWYKNNTKDTTYNAGATISNCTYQVSASDVDTSNALIQCKLEEN